MRVYEWGCPGARKFCCATCSTFKLHFYVKETGRIPFFLLFTKFILRSLWTVLVVCITCYSWGELLFILYRSGGSAFCVSPVFVRSQREKLYLIYYYFRGKVCFVFIHFRVIFSPALPVGRGVWRTFFNLSKMMYRLAFCGSRHSVPLLSLSLVDIVVTTAAHVFRACNVTTWLFVSLPFWKCTRGTHRLKTVGKFSDLYFGLFLTNFWTLNSL